MITAKRKEKGTVYKVVEVRKQNGKTRMYSVFATGSWLVEYKLGQLALPKFFDGIESKLFAFSTLNSAKSFMSGHDEFITLKCEGYGITELERTIQCLVPDRDKWADLWKTFLAEGYNEKTCGLGYPFYEGAVTCVAIMPLEIMKGRRKK